MVFVNGLQQRLKAIQQPGSYTQSILPHTQVLKDFILAIYNSQLNTTYSIPILEVDFSQ